MYTMKDNIKLGVEVETYKWYLYQVEGHHTEYDTPCAVFYHAEEAKMSYEHLVDRYPGIRFVLTNIKTGESYA